MFQIFQEEKGITITMLSFLAISIFIRVLLGAIYQSMIRETDNMAATKNKLLKQCKIKFANCYQLNNGVANIPVFVDKFLNRLSVGPISFETLYHLSGQTMLFSVVAAGVGICKSIMDGKMLGEILPFYIASFAGLYLYFSISTVVDIKGKRRVLKVNLVDYLENHFSARIHVTEQDLDMLYGNATYEEADYYGMLRDGIHRERRLGEKGMHRMEGIRTVELMPIGGRMGTERGRIMAGEESGEKRRSVSEEPVEAGYAQVTAEELDALLQEFLTV